MVADSPLTGPRAARGLNAAHKLGIIHRDLKPDNIFLTYPDDVEAGLVPALPVGNIDTGRAQDPPLQLVVVKLVDAGLRYLNRISGGTPIDRGAPRTRATSLSPHPIRGRFWLLNVGTHVLFNVVAIGKVFPYPEGDECERRESMAIQLTPEQERRVHNVINRGAYESVEEVMDAALTAVEQRTVPGFAGTQEELDAQLAEGLASKELAEDEFWGSVNTQTNALLAEHKPGPRS